MTRSVSFSFRAMLVGGVLLALGAGLMALNKPGADFSVQVLTGQFAVAAVLRLVGTTLALIGIAGIHARQSDRAGVFGQIAYVLVVFNLILQISWMWSDLFMTRPLATYAPGLLDGTVDQGRLGVAFLMAWLMNATFSLLGIATLRAKVYRRTAGWAMIAAGAITLVPLPVDGPIYEVFIGLAFAVVGWSVLGTSPVVEPDVTGVGSNAGAAVRQPVVD